MTHRITVWLRTGIYWQAKRRFGRAAVTQKRKYSKFLIPLYRHVVYSQVYCLSLSIVQLELLFIDYALYFWLLTIHCTFDWPSKLSIVMLSTNWQTSEVERCIWIEVADCPFTISRLKIGLKPTWQRIPCWYSRTNACRRRSKWRSASGLDNFSCRPSQTRMVTKTATFVYKRECDSFDPLLRSLSRLFISSQNFIQPSSLVVLLSSVARTSSKLIALSTPYFLPCHLFQLVSHQMFFPSPILLILPSFAFPTTLDLGPPVSASLDGTMMDSSFRSHLPIPSIIWCVLVNWAFLDASHVFVCNGSLHYINVRIFSNFIQVLMFLIWLKFCTVDVV